MNVTVKSLSLSYDQVRSILQDWINANVLRAPHTVVDIDPWAYAEHEEMQFNIELQPGLAGEPVVTEVTPILHALPAGPVTVGTNGTNGHAKQNGGGQTPDKKEVTAAPSSDGRKRGRTLSEEERERVIGLVNSGVKRATIAQSIGISDRQLYAVIAELRAAGELPERTQPAVA